MKEITHTYLKKVLKDKKKWIVNESFIKNTKIEETARNIGPVAQLGRAADS